MTEHVIYVKASTERYARYKHFTEIIQKEHRLCVRKIPCGKEAEDHIRNLVINREILEASIKDHDALKIAPCTLLENGAVEFPFYEFETLQDMLENADPEQYIAQVLRFRNILEKGFACCSFVNSEEFCEYFGEHGLSEGCAALCTGNVDMVFSNVFVDKGAYILTDYEWVLPFPVPLDFIVYRGLLIDPALVKFSVNDQRRIWESLGFTESLKNKYYAMEVRFQSRICGRDHSLDRFENPKVKNKCDDLSTLMTYKSLHFQDKQNRLQDTAESHSSMAYLGKRIKNKLKTMYLHFSK